MLAGLITGQRKLGFVEVAEPEAGPGKVVVAIRYCGICGTDLHAYQIGRAHV